MATWTREEVLGLAPGADGPRSVARLAASGSWSGAGTLSPGQPSPGHPSPGQGAVAEGADLLPGPAVWGECQGSARLPYVCVVSADRPVASSCTCPSRRSPCKHALALLLRWVEGAVEVADPPVYARRWLEARFAREQADGGTTGTPATRAPVDAEAAAKRAAARTQRVGAGLDELAQWLRDQVRGGLAGLEQGGADELERVAARLVDAQAPGVAGLLRGVRADLRSEDWPTQVLDALAGVHLLVEAHRRLPSLPPARAATVRSRVGYPTSKADVLAGPGVLDDWWGVGQVDTVEDRLETRRVWLWGSRSARWALFLSYAPPGMELDATVVAGSRIRAPLHFYPGSGSFRALVGAPAAGLSVGAPAAGLSVGTSAAGSSVEDPGGLVEAPRPGTVAEERGRFATLLAEDPWASRMPCVLAGLPAPPRRSGARWGLVDPAGDRVELLDLGGDPWPLIAYAGSGAVLVFGEWTPAGLRPLSLLPDPDGTRVFTTDLLGRAA